MMGFRLQDPIWCFLLIPLFIVVLFAVYRQRHSAVLYSSVQLLKSLPFTFALLIKRLLPWVRFLGMALVILALARPQHGREEFRVRTEGIAIQMAIDKSGSMQALDFELEGVVLASQPQSIPLLGPASRNGVVPRGAGASRPLIGFRDDVFFFYAPPGRFVLRGQVFLGVQTGQGAHDGHLGADFGQVVALPVSCDLFP